MKEIVYHTNYELEESYWWFLARNRIILNVIDKMLNLSKDDEILDVGCGTCGFAKLLSHNHKVIGLDTSDIALEYCRKRGLNDLYLSLIADFPKEKRNVKAVTALDVIEHIENDFNAVRDIYNLLPKNGKIVATVPAYQFLWSYHDEVHKHYRRYTKKRFVALLKSAGFEIDYASYFNTLLFLPGIFKRLLDKFTVPLKSEEYAIEIVPKFINKLFTKIFEFEKHFIPKIRFPFGISIIVVATKK
ncbi:MAG: class I SAM-dependent methyltransferase [Candidatus Kapaibacteriota bacterium]